MSAAPDKRRYVILVPGGEPVTLPASAGTWRSGHIALAVAIVAGKKAGDHFRLSQDGRGVSESIWVKPGEYELVGLGGVV